MAPMFPLFLSLIALAAPSAEYQRFDDLRKDKQALWSFQQEATTPLHVKNGHFCTAVFVGPNGEALTNLHCLESCIEASGRVKKSEILGTELFTNMPSPGAICEVSIRAQSGKKLEVVQTEVLSIFGPGWISPREKMNDFLASQKEKALGLMREGYEAAGDLALVRLPRKGACVRLGDNSFQTAEALTNLAYPILMRKSDNNPMSPVFLTMGTTLLISQGAATKDANVLRIHAPAFPDFENYLPFLLLPGVLMSSTDAESGSSGSPLFNEQGKLVALTRSTWKGNTGNYIPWTTQAVNLVEKKEIIESFLPGLEACR